MVLLGAVVGAVAIAFADSSIVVLALPQLYATFDTSIEGIAWVITSYNLVLAVAALALVPVVHRVRANLLLGLGTLVFLGGSIACALADSLTGLIVARSVQGLGGAILLASSVRVLGTLAGSTLRGITIWTAAGTFGAALGPALGGTLAQVFDWRAIFVVQAPIAGAALLAAGVRVSEPAKDRTAWLGRALPANLALTLVSGALVGALFLGVLLLVDVFGHRPIAAAAILSLVPGAALLARPLARHLSVAIAAGGGAVLLAAGLAGLALLPSSDLGPVVVSFILCGSGLGLAIPGLTHAALADGGDVDRRATVTVGLRHLGLVLSLAVVAPVLAADLLDSGRRRDPERGGRRDRCAHPGDDQDPARPGHPRCARARPRRRDAGPDGAVRGARRGDRPRGRGRAGGPRCEHRAGRHAGVPPFVPVLRVARGAGVGPGPRLPAEGLDVNSRRVAMAILVTMMLAGGALVGFELASGALEAGALAVRDPCEPRRAFSGEGLDATLQRIVLDGLDGAACELGTTRERFVLSLDAGPGQGSVPWDDATIERALRAGLLEAIDDAEARGSLNAIVAFALRQAVEHGPVQWLVDGGQGIAGLFD